MNSDKRKEILEQHIAVDIKKFKPRFNLRKIYTETYSLGYSLKTIDFELCLYKNFEIFDLEFSGLNNARKKFWPYSPDASKNRICIYVWNKSGKGVSGVGEKIYCQSLDEVIEMCKIINNANKKFRVKEEIPEPFNLLFEPQTNYDAWIIEKRNGKWAAQKESKYIVSTNKV